MQKKILGYVLLVAVIGLLGYNSVYFKKLSILKKEQAAAANFDATAYAKNIWDNLLPAKLDSAITLTDLYAAIKANPENAFNNYSNALAIGNYRYSLVKLQGTITKTDENEAELSFPYADSTIHIQLQTEFVYGNAVRDASGLVDIRNFTNTTDLNNISESLNKIIRSTVIPPFKKSLKTGDKLEVTGAIEINKAHIKINGLELIPVRIKTMS